MSNLFVTNAFNTNTIFIARRTSFLPYNDPRTNVFEVRATVFYRHIQEK